MTTISPLQQILAQIRTALAERTRTAPQRGSEARAPTPADRLKELQGNIRSGLAALDLRSVEGRSSARRVFLESVLLSEFGARLANDPKFPELVAQVQAAIDDQESLRKQLDHLVTQLGS